MVYGSDVDFDKFATNLNAGAAWDITTDVIHAIFEGQSFENNTLHWSVAAITVNGERIRNPINEIRVSSDGEFGEVVIVLSEPLEKSKEYRIWFSVRYESGESVCLDISFESP